jgi:hypothetical protein
MTLPWREGIPKNLRNGTDSGTLVAPARALSQLRVFELSVGFYRANQLLNFAAALLGRSQSDRISFVLHHAQQKLLYIIRAIEISLWQHRQIVSFQGYLFPVPCSQCHLIFFVGDNCLPIPKGGLPCFLKWGGKTSVA